MACTGPKCVLSSVHHCVCVCECVVCVVVCVCVWCVCVSVCVCVMCVCVACVFARVCLHVYMSACVRGRSWARLCVYVQSVCA